MHLTRDGGRYLQGSESDRTELCVAQHIEITRKPLD